MIRAGWRRITPWLIPAVVVAEGGLVDSGSVSLRSGVIVVIVIETAFVVTAVSRLLAAARSYRAGRTEGREGWAAAEDSLAQLVPRRFARLLLFEPRLFACLIRWIAGRGDARRPGSFGYHRALRPLLAMIVGLVVVEGILVDAVIAALVPSGPWLWIAIGLHIYALVWLISFYASLVVRPHQIRPDGLHIRDGIFTDVRIPYHAIIAARAAHKSNLGRSGLKIEAETGAGILAVGDATIALDLDPGQPIVMPAGSLLSLRITVDEPADFLDRLRTARRRAGRDGGRPLPRSTGPVGNRGHAPSAESLRSQSGL